MTSTRYTVPVVVDRFVERVAEVAGQTVRRLREHQRLLFEIGLTAEAQDLEQVIRAHEAIVFDCAEDTMPGSERPTAENPVVPKITDK